MKTNSDGSIERYKARLVAQGFNQKFGSDYDETFCPVVRLESSRTLIALSAQRELELHHIDVSTAFLNGTLQEEVYMKQPVGHVKKGEEHLVCRLRKSIYGLKQSSRCWNMALDAHLRKMGFTQSKSDPCIYILGGDKAFFIGVYVDDMVLAGNDNTEIERVKEELSARFDLKDLVTSRKSDVSGHLYEARHCLCCGNVSQVLKQTQPGALGSSKESTALPGTGIIFRGDEPGGYSDAD